MDAAEPGGPFQVFGEPRPHAVELGQEPLVAGQLVEALLRDDSEHADRIGIAALPEEPLGLQASKEFDRLRVPAPPEVPGNAQEILQPSGDPGGDRERVRTIHLGLLRGGRRHRGVPSARRGRGSQCRPTGRAYCGRPPTAKGFRLARNRKSA